MKKIFSTTILIALCLVFSSAARAEGIGYQYSQVDTQQIDSSMAANGGSISALNGAFNFSFSTGTLKTAGRVEFMELKLDADSSMALPEDYNPISGIFEYQLRGTGFNPKAPVRLEIPFHSTQEFDKYLLRYDQKKERWVEVASITDLEKGVTAATLPLANAKFVLTELSTMTNGHASWYRFKKCMCAASPDYPKGTKLLVTNLDKNLSIVVKVNDWGPERDIFPDRVIDLDLVAFQKLAKKGAGVMKNVSVHPFIAAKYEAGVAKKLLAGEAVKLEEGVSAATK